MAFENSAEQHKPSEVHQPSTAALLPSNADYQNYYKPRIQSCADSKFLDFGIGAELYNLHNREQKSQSQDIQTDSPPKVAQNIDGYMPPPTLLFPNPDIMRIIGDTALTAGVGAYKYGFEHPYRGRELTNMATIPAQSWSQAFNSFPELKAIGNLSEQSATQLMKALVANELDHYDWRDNFTDSLAVAAHGQSKFGEITVGFAQISPKGVRDMANDFETDVQSGDRKNNPLAKYLKMSNEQILQSLSNPREMPLLVAANIAHNVGMYSRNHYPITEQTLGYGFNPDLPPQRQTEGHEMMPPQERLDKSEHAKNISNWLKQIRAAESGK